LFLTWIDKYRRDEKAADKHQKQRYQKTLKREKKQFLELFILSAVKMFWWLSFASFKTFQVFSPFVTLLCFICIMVQISSNYSQTCLNDQLSTIPHVNNYQNSKSRLIICLERISLMFTFSGPKSDRCTQIVLTLLYLANKNLAYYPSGNEQI
jgi:hypothetical protein